jgi:hypothetical protein
MILSWRRRRRQNKVCLRTNPPQSFATSGEFHKIDERIGKIEDEQKSSSEMQKQIGVYHKTHKVYDAYKRSGWDRAFYDANAADIILHRAAKKYFYAEG